MIKINVKMLIINVIFFSYNITKFLQINIKLPINVML